MNNIEENKCTESKEGIDFLIGLFSGPKTHRVAGGFEKGDSATLNIEYIWADEKVSNADVTMKRNDQGKWIFGGLSAHAEQQIDVQASAKATFGNGTGRQPAVSSSATTTFKNGTGTGDGPFGPINMAANRRQYTGYKCPIDIIYTAAINFRLPLPKDFAFKYHWERSDGVKEKEQVISPTGKERAMSVREIWRLGAPGKQYIATIRLFIDAGNTHIIKESPAVKVICK